MGQERPGGLIFDSGALIAIEEGGERMRVATDRFADPDVLEWLLSGDPMIRWQVMRDLLDEPESVWRAERERVVNTGWGAGYFSQQRPDGSWAAGRWTETTWTLLVLMDCGVTTPNDSLRRAAEQQIGKLLPRGRPVAPLVLRTRLDLCHVGFWLRFGSAFIGSDDRLKAMVDAIFALQMADGGWNCRIRNYPETTHSSFNTTFNVLEGLRQAAQVGVVDRGSFQAAESRAIEFMLAHRLFKSDKIGAIVDEDLTYLTFPWYWHYRVQRGLDYLRETPWLADPRVDDAIALLVSQRRPNGRWPLGKRIPGVTFFDMEKPGGDSRWNTLRALRVLRARLRLA